MGIDLHCHSCFSDGELTPQQLLQLARQKQLHTLALTDHDSIAGCAELLKLAPSFAVRAVAGVEISAHWQRPNTQKYHSVHIVALNMKNLHPIEQLLQKQQQLRAERALRICEKLKKIIKIDVLPDVRTLVDGHDDRITRTHIAQVLLQHGVISRHQQAFDRYLKQGKSAYVPFLGTAMAEVIDIIHQSQGVAVLAHPTKYDLTATNIRKMVATFAQAGGDAVELPPDTEPLATRDMMDYLIAQWQLQVSVGSDFHGAHMPWLKLGEVPCIKAGQTPVWQAWSNITVNESPMN